MNILADVIKGVTGPVADFFTRRAEIKAQERQLASQERIKMHEIRMAQYDRQATLFREGLAADASWEMEFVKQAATSWKDEYALLIVTIPIGMCFIPGLAPYVADGFRVLKENVPVWFVLVWTTLMLATFGIRYMRRNQYDTENPMDALTSSLLNRPQSSTTGSTSGSASLGLPTSVLSAESLERNSSG